MASKSGPYRARRPRGAGAVFQRCDAKRGCPPMQTIQTPAGPERLRPDHKCRGMWIGRLDLGWVDGVHLRPMVSAATKKTCNEKLLALQEALTESGGILPDKKMTVVKWLRYWVEEIAPKKPNTLDFYRDMVCNHLIPGIGERLTMTDFQNKPAHYRELQKRLLAKASRYGGLLSTTTVRHACQALGTALDAAILEKIITRNVAKLVKPPKRAASKPEYHQAQEVGRVLDVLDGHPRGSRWKAAYYTAARQGECLGLCWPMVDWEDCKIDFCWQLQRIDYRHGCDDVAACTEQRHRIACPEANCAKAKRFNNHTCWKPDDPTLCKAGCAGHAKACPKKEVDVPRDYEHRVLDGGLCLVRPKSEAGKRLVPIVDELFIDLRRDYDRYLKARKDYKVDHGLVWPRPDGRPMDAKVDRKEWDTIQEEAGVRRIKPHGARHTANTTMRKLGVDVKLAGQISGHASEESTEGYRHTDLDDARGALASMAEHLAGWPC